ncbi:MAG: phosphoribosylamine--glycine ligase [Candidatus Krumholzibacteria bacterium]|nr:phosphoribosylamine--glycine ligase [Candidatus Krumholzibacteria bacterium]
MKVLVIGGGGREHALVWKISKSPQVDKIYAAPGNAGIAQIAECIPMGAGDTKALLGLALEKEIDLTVVGPEAPLVEGIVDLFAGRGLRIFGFDRKGARLEGSKVWAKEFMKRHGIPTGGFSVFNDPQRALKAIEASTPPFVIKADGLAAGKGVLIANSDEEAGKAVGKIMKDKVFGAAGDRIIVEEYLTGEEISVLGVFDGATYRLFAPSQDHKRAYDGDKGPNTGGMGAYASVLIMGNELEDCVRERIIEPTFNGMREDGIAGVGVLYFGLIITEDGPRVLEYNCRFGDPETQVILPLFDGDLVEVMFESTSQNLGHVPFSNSSETAACIVMASGGYPGSYKKGYVVEGLDNASGAGCIVFHAGTVSREGKVRTSGGRVLGVTAIAPTLKGSLDKAYRGVGAIHFKDSYFRHDIGKKGMKHV